MRASQASCESYGAVWLGGGHLSLGQSSARTVGLGSPRVIAEYAKERADGTAMHYKWQKHTADQRDFLCATIEWRPWTTDVPGVRGLPVSWKRECDLVEVGWIKRLLQKDWQSLAAAKSGWFANASQGVQCSGVFGGIKTLTTGLPQ